MELNKVYRFEDIGHFKGWLMFNDESISFLESEIKRIRASFEMIKKQSEANGKKGMWRIVEHSSITKEEGDAYVG